MNILVDRWDIYLYTRATPLNPRKAEFRFVIQIILLDKNRELLQRQCASRVPSSAS